MSPESIVIIVSQVIQSLAILVSIRHIKSQCISELDIERNPEPTERNTLRNTLNENK